MLGRKIKIITYAFFFSILFGFAGAAQAAVSLDVSGVHDHMFSEDNIYPGWTDSHTVNVKNTSDGSEVIDVYATFDITDNSDLTKKIHLYVIREADNKYMLGGVGDRITLDEADGDRIFIDRLDAGESEDYKIKLRFDSDAGNEYQELSSDFDIDLGFESDEVPGGGTPLPKVVSGEKPPEEVAGVSTPEEGAENQGAQLGAETTCQSWPQWIWIVAILAYALILLKYLQNNYKAEKMVWKFGLVWTVAAVTFWYFRDKCREYQWFLYGSIIIAVASYFIYLWMLKKKVKSGTLPVDHTQE
ncbi:MAG: hypothetical protein WCV59_03125 [Parcubacteria group bacterium]|jgi:hypothetical protein